MPSADFCRPLPWSLGHGSTRTVRVRAGRQISPGKTPSPSRLYPPHLRCHVPYRYRTLEIFASLSRDLACYAIPVRRVSVLPAASFRFHLAMDTLAVRLTVPPVGPVGDLHPQVNAPCRAHKAKKPGRTDQAFRSNPCFTSCRLVFAGTHPLYILRAQTFRRALDIILKLFSIAKPFIPAETVNAVSMNKDISTALIGFDEAVAFVHAEPFYPTACHGVV